MLNRSVWNSFVRSSLVALLALCASLAMAEDSVLVAGGAGYKRPIDEIANGFEAASKIKVERIYGHMGHVLQQTRASGKVAVVFGEQDVLEKAEQVVFSKYLPLGRGRLVLAWPKGKMLKNAAELRREGFARIGVADIKQAIFGKASVEYLQHSGLYPAVEKRLIMVSTVPQVSAYLISGEVDAGFINLTEALGIRDKIGGFIEIPVDEYAPIRITAGLVAGQDSAPVRALVDYMQTPAAAEIIKRYGL
ncbi:molybdate ABC transporter substrate-binding protein [Uliginosibacterium flavum]|uniref:Molybdate ABC transporter substrate-binding protein n=1 Tax=Uliginosibacterium flavum TaxID=1396831 RepID=A0ABV2TKI8_9RHOO